MGDRVSFSDSIDWPPFERADLRQSLERAAKWVETGISEALEGRNGDVADAMRYSLIGGKALRCFLVQETARLHGQSSFVSLLPSLAIECIHAYSLVHDDLPCMDDDDLRRGQPTVHRKWDEATAVLAGDALQALAFELIGGTQGLADDAKVRLMTTLAKASGVTGMVGGQAMDIAAETSTKPLSLDKITALQAKKTGALITWACCAGPRMAGAEDGRLTTYGDALGLAFQIADDILDVQGDAAIVGKAVSKDEAAGKATFVSLLGLDGAKRRAAELVESAQDALSPYGEDADTLREAAQFVITRKK